MEFSPLRLRAFIVDVTGGRELHIDTTNFRGDVISRLKMSGYQYLVKNSKGEVYTVFTFSSAHYPYSHESFTKFLAAVRVKKDSSFHFDSTPQFSAGFSYRSGSFCVETVHGTSRLTVTIPYSIALIDDLTEIDQYITRYIEESVSSQIQDLARELRVKSLRY